MLTSPLMIWHVANPKGGVPEEEYVQIFALGDVNLAGYALVDRTFDSEGVVSNEFRHIFVFPSLSVEAGDTVYVYTGCGTNGPFIGDGGSTVHLLYWGAKHCVWNNRGGDSATIIRYTVEASGSVPAAK